MIKNIINKFGKFFFDFTFFALYVAFWATFAFAIIDVLAIKGGGYFSYELWMPAVMWTFLMAARWLYKTAGHSGLKANLNPGANGNNRRQV